MLLFFFKFSQVSFSEISFPEVILPLSLLLELPFTLDLSLKLFLFPGLLTGKLLLEELFPEEFFFEG